MFIDKFQRNAHNGPMTPDTAVVTAMEDARQRWDRRRETIDYVARIVGITHTRLAELMGMSRQTMSGRLTGLTKIEPWEMAGFAVVLGVPVEVLEMTPKKALEWIAANGSEEMLTLRSRCTSLSPLVAA